MAESDSERTEAATPRRREEARQDGNIARSPDLTAAGALLAAVVLLQVLGLRVFAALKQTVVTLLGAESAGNPTRPDDLRELLN